MKRARTFRAANAQMRQVGFGFLDLLLHVRYDAARDGDPVAYTRGLLQEFSPAPLPAEHTMIAAFPHLFAAPVGYGAGYTPISGRRCWRRTRSRASAMGAF
jgi:oligopeptidase A